jgi:hypothetical protein
VTLSNEKRQASRSQPVFCQNADIGGRLEIDPNGTTLWIPRAGTMTEVSLPAGVVQFLQDFRGRAHLDLETPA